jgi:hypothetical protein
LEQVSQADKDAMKDAARLMRAGHGFEEALGMAVRHEKMEYSDYVRLASFVRTYSKKERIELELALRRLSRSENEQN